VTRSSSLLLGASLLGLVGCEGPKLAEPPAAPPAPEASTASEAGLAFPVRWTLTDTQGRRLSATLVGRTAQVVSLVRDSDGQRYDLPLDRLVPADRARVESLPLVPAPAAPPRPPQPAGKAPAKAVARSESGPLRMKRAALEEKEREYQKLKTEQAGASSTIQSRSLNRRLDRLALEMSGLKAEIDQLEARGAAAR
jgi:hypothetical protein